MTRKYCTITLLISHPENDLEFISDELCLTPSTCRKKGDKLFTKKGRPLSARSHDSRWSYIKEFHGEDDLEGQMLQMINFIYPQKKTFQRLALEGGKSTLILRFSGSIHYGFEFSVSMLKKLVEIEIVLGLEVFPHS